jgi:ATP synthase F1 delta subunit
MKKISAKKYAEALYEMTIDKDQVELKIVVEDFVKTLARNNDLRKEARVIGYFCKILAENEGYLEAEVKTANKLEDEACKRVEGFIRENSGIKKIILKEEIDKSLLGGLVISYGDKVLDGSLRARLNDFKNTMIK